MDFIEYTPNLIKENQRMSTCNQLDLQTLGSLPIMTKNLPDHCSICNVRRLHRTRLFLPRVSIPLSERCQSILRLLKLHNAGYLDVHVCNLQHWQEISVPLPLFQIVNNIAMKRTHDKSNSIKLKRIPNMGSKSVRDI